MRINIEAVCVFISFLENKKPPGGDMPPEVHSLFSSSLTWQQAALKNHGSVSCDRTVYHCSEGVKGLFFFAFQRDRQRRSITEDGEGGRSNGERSDPPMAPVG